MKIVRCDNHPDRDAVISVVVRVVPTGSRPLFLGVETPRKVHDLCAECRDAMPMDLQSLATRAAQALKDRVAVKNKVAAAREP